MEYIHRLPETMETLKLQLTKFDQLNRGIEVKEVSFITTRETVLPLECEVCN